MKLMKFGLTYCTLILVWCINLCSALDASSLKSYSVTTLINAKWRQTPLYLEISEYLADDNDGLFWDFVKGITELDTPLNEYGTESKQYLSALNVVRSFVGTLQMPLLKLILSLHSLTPRINAHLQISSEAQQIAKCDTSTFAQIGTEYACDVIELQQKLHLQKKSLDMKVETYSFDHSFPGSENKTRTVVLYGDIGSREFVKFHEILSQEALSGKCHYIIRHHMITLPNRRVRLSGYGVELHLKSTEYKSQDDAPKNTEDDVTKSDDSAIDVEIQGFDFKILKARFPSLTHSLNQFRHSLLEDTQEIAQLKAWEFQDLGLQATAAIAEIEGEEALQILQFTANNFPMQARSLLNHKVSESLREEIKWNTEIFGRTLNIVPPDGAIFVNGLYYDADTMDLGAFVETLRTEIRVLENLYQNKIRGKAASALLALDFSSNGNRNFAIDIRDTAIMWINDIESDPHYRRWPASVMDLMRPTFPGMLRNIRKNVFHLVLVVDPLSPHGRSLIKLVESFVIHSAPVRLGLVFDTRQSTNENVEDYNAIICSFNYISQKKDYRASLSFLTDIYTHVKNNEKVTHKHILSQLKKSFPSLSNDKINDIISEDSDYDYGRKLSAEFIERLGFEDSPQALLNGVPMQNKLLSSDNDFEEAIFTEIIQQTSTLQKAVYRGDLTDSEPVIDYLMNQANVMPRLNQRILSTESEKFLDLTGNPYHNLNNVRKLAQLSNRDMTATLLNNLKYFTNKHATEHIGGSELQFLTVWVFGDLEHKFGRNLLMNALEYLKTANSMRVAFIPNIEEQNFKRNNLNSLVWAAMHSLPHNEATEIVLSWLKRGSDIQDIPASTVEYLSSTELHIKMLRVYAQRVLGLRKNEQLIIANGKKIGPFQYSDKFSVDDYGLIDRFNALQYGDKIRKVLTEGNLNDTDDKITSDMLLKLYCSLVPRQSKTRFHMPNDAKQEHSVLKLNPKSKDLPYFDVNAVVDPASRSAQKLAPILILLRNTFNCQMRVFLTPVSQHSDMPIKNFYRYVIEQEPQFEPHGRLADGPIAKFTGLPVNSLLTQNLQVPENWLVESVRSVYDLDNIKLNEIGGPVHSEFELEYLLLEGHCFDAVSGAPPRGLQIILGTKNEPDMVDTIVMANLGYFQLKANPGIWELRLRDGKSADIYDITHAEGLNTLYTNHSIKIVISSLRSHVIKIRVAKKAGKQSVDLLGDEDDQYQTGIWNSIANSFGGSGNSKQIAEDETINIFSVASGHLYERLLRIMMISLLKHTKSPVKFWFLKNYLSPQFTDFLPHMAKEYGFNYELVQYKWPRWLHQQTEKQRTIWGYKILFLDVLFPLNVRKIIFVDADAIVRADIKELFDMDLGGAPYAYTPFCDSRKEMEGFRFWKQGYWRSHLMGRRYHISALYVVDLKRFRRIAAGDRLRGQYQALSQDPNSLSNLDQDLPNNMIHQVAIKSLPNDWLWCQTWCSDSAFKNAKVIDLCNNPQTKEAKLTAAQRIVPEWKTYDAEIKKLMAKVEDHENVVEHEIYMQSEKPHTSAQSDSSESGSIKHSEL